MPEAFRAPVDLGTKAAWLFDNHAPWFQVFQVARDLDNPASWPQGTKVPRCVHSLGSQSKLQPCCQHFKSNGNLDALMTGNLGRSEHWSLDAKVDMSPMLLDAVDTLARA
jgi:hypothetical protein